MFVLQSRHATVSIDSMLLALQQTAAEKVCIALPPGNHLDMKYMRRSIENKNLGSPFSCRASISPF